MSKRRANIKILFYFISRYYIYICELWHSFNSKLTLSFTGKNNIFSYFDSLKSKNNHIVSRGVMALNGRVVEFESIGLGFKCQ